jgi:hypothetical protein
VVESSGEAPEVLDAVNAEGPDVVAEVVPGQCVPDGEVVVEVLRLDVAVGDGAVPVEVGDPDEPLMQEGVQQRSGDAWRRRMVGGEHLRGGGPADEDAAAQAQDPAGLGRGERRPDLTGDRSQVVQQEW